PQPGDGKAPDRVDVVRGAGGGDVLAVDLDAGAVQVGAGDVLDVVAAVAVLGPAGILRRAAVRARLHRDRQVVYLRAGVVVVVLAGDVPAVGGEHAADAVADDRGAAVADVQRPGRVGRHVLDAGAATAPGGVAPVGLGLGEHIAQLAAPGRLGHVEVDEARSGDLDPGDVVV